MEMMNRHDVRQDDGSEKMSTTTMVAAVDGGVSSTREIRPQELFFYPVHFFDCGFVVVTVLAKRAYNYKVGGLLCSKGEGGGKEERRGE